MIITINGHQLPNILVGSTYKQSLEDELESLAVVYQDDKKPAFIAHDIAIVNDKKWVIGSYNSELVARIPKIKYRTTLMLVELTKLLERYVLGPCAFTNKDDTLMDQIQKALSQAEVLRGGESHNFIFANPDNIQLSYEFINLLNATSGEEFFFNSQMTLREVLDKMLSVLNYRVVVSNIGDNGKLHLHYRDLNRQSEDIKPLERVVNEAENQSMEYLAGEYETSVQNALSKDGRVMEEEWQTLKPTSIGTVDTEGMRLVVSNPIEELAKVELKVMATTIGYTYQPSGIPNAWADDVVFKIDITDLFVEQEIYDTMDLPTQEKHIPYSRGSKEIGVLATYKKLFFTKVKLADKIRELYKVPAKQALLDAGIILETAIIGSIELDTDALYENLLFRTSYVPYLDLHFSQTKENANLPFKSVMISNQQDETVEVGRYANSLRALANKLGNKVYEVDVNLSKIILAEETCPTCNGTGDGEIREEMCDVCDGVGHIIENEVPVLCGTCGGDGKIVYVDDCKLCGGDGIIAESRPKTAEEMVDDLLKPGDRIAGDYTLVSREYSLFQTITPHIKCHYTFIQHYSNVLATKLSRERRLYKIPLEDIVDRDTLLKDYLILSTAKDLKGDGILSDTITLPYFLKTFNNTNDENTPMERLKFSTAEDTIFSLPLLGTALGKIMHWQTKCYDNFSAGLSTGVRTIGGKGVYQNPYVDEDGEFANLVFQLIKSNINGFNFDTQLYVGRFLPIIPFQLHVGYTKVDFTNGEKTIIVNKDRFERFGFSHQLEPMAKKADMGKIIIGDSFAKYANLLYGKNQTLLYIWTSQTETYRQSEMRECKGARTAYKPKIDAANYSVTADVIPQTAIKSWAIGDEAGNLILAVNNNFAYANVYFTISRNMV